MSLNESPDAPSVASNNEAALLALVPSSEAALRAIGALAPVDQLDVLFAFNAALKEEVLANLRRRFVALVPNAVKLTWDWDNENCDDGTVASYLSTVRLSRADGDDLALARGESIDNDPDWWEIFVAEEDQERIEAMAENGYGPDFDAIVLESAGRALGVSGPEYRELAHLASMLAYAELEVGETKLGGD